jgi:hypothetical protein
MIAACEELAMLLILGGCEVPIIVKYGIGYR